jgi:hypothetical protein
VKAFEIEKRLQLLCDYCDEIKNRRYDSPEQESQILREDCRQIRLIAERLREMDANSLQSLPNRAADPIVDLSNLLNWIERALRIEMSHEKRRGESKMACPESDLPWDRRALSLLEEHPNWVGTSIARELGTQQSTLVRSRLFSQAMALERSRLQRLPASTTGSGTADENSNGAEIVDSQHSSGDSSNK